MAVSGEGPNVALNWETVWGWQPCSAEMPACGPAQCADLPFRQNMAAIRLRNTSVVPLLGGLGGEGERGGRKERVSELGNGQNMAAILYRIAC